MLVFRGIHLLLEIRWFSSSLPCLFWGWASFFSKKLNINKGKFLGISTPEWKITVNPPNETTSNKWKIWANYCIIIGDVPGGKKRCNKWDIYHINWLAGFLPSTEVYCSSIPAGMVHVLASLVMKTNHGDDLGCSCFSPQDAIVESIKVLGWDSQSPK